jgi:enamine deaminase RidA (YjgF/YER057c/UK114 family)
MSNIKTALDMIINRRNHYLVAESYYDGLQREIFTNDVWLKLFRQDNKHFRFNFAKTVVDAVSNRLEIANITGMTPEANDELTKVWEDNQLELDSSEIHRNALIYGDSYAIVWTDSFGKTTVDYNSPLTTVVIYDDENPRIKSYAAKLWQTSDSKGKNIAKLNMYYSDRIEKYESFGEIENIVSASSFKLVGIVENPWGQVPVFHFRTTKQYGRPEHLDAYGPQDAINKMMATHMVTVDYQGAPQRYALSSGGNGAEYEDFNESGTVDENLGRLKNGPGELWYLNGVSKVGEFAPADYKVFTEPVREFVRSMASITSTPLHYFEKTAIPSGESLRTAEAPLQKKVKDRQVSFTAAWKELLQFALSMSGIKSDVDVKWEPAESLASLDAWEVAVKKRVVGVTLEQVLVEMGYDQEVAAQIAAAEAPLTNMSQNVNTNNVLMQSTGGQIGNTGN